MIHFISKGYYFLIILVSVLGLCACKPIDVLNLTIPRKGYSVFYDLPYGNLPQQNLDIYVPNKLSIPHSTLIYFYGGSWQYGDKNMYRFIGQSFASKGFIVVVVNYRLFPEVYFPAFMQDGAKAIRWVHNNINRYGGDKEHVFLAGHSAGAQIATLLITDNSYLKAEGGNSYWIKGIIGISGPYDFLPFTDPKVKMLFSKVDDAKTQPINFVTPGLPPFFLATGDNDTTVFPKNTINFANKLREAAVPVKEIIYPKLGHIGIILSLAPIFHYKSPLREDITEFINSVNEKYLPKKVE
jgi:acetyl esterase/lipase